MKLKQRKAQITDLHAIVSLLMQDELGKTREKLSGEIDGRYTESFERIQSDPNQYLMVVTLEGGLVGTCHLSLIPSLTFLGSLRLQIEAVRVDQALRGQGIGEWMIKQAIEYGERNNASIVQLTTNKERTSALSFYEKLGFQVTHEGMKLYL